MSHTEIIPESLKRVRVVRWSWGRRDEADGIGKCAESGRFWKAVNPRTEPHSEAIAGMAK